MKKSCFAFLVVASSLASSVIAQTWIHQTNEPTSGYGSGAGIAVSADGIRPIAAVYYPINPLDYTGEESPIFYSTNSGMIWSSGNSLSPYYWWSLVSSSADGETLAVAAIDGSVSVSTNSGISWTQSIPASQSWNSVTASSDGNTLVLAGENTSIYISTNSGITWTNSHPDVPYNFWSSVAAAVKGGKIFAANYLGSIYFTTNYGVTWSATAAPVLQWWSMASSADGNKLVAGALYSPIFVSTNSGVTWTVTATPSANWTSVATSADGKKLAAIQQDDGRIYTSTDSGMTWVTNNAPGTNWNAIVSSADGERLFAVTENGQIWSKFSMPSPELNLAFASNNLLLSWTVPSTSFVLQQNSNLASTNWSVVTNAPVLNFTNLQNEIRIPLSNGSVFYRLTTP
jgi:photosystem II stability/assembly factor-like uncharacterized protein